MFSNIFQKKKTYFLSSLFISISPFSLDLLIFSFIFSFMSFFIFSVLFRLLSSLSSLLLSCLLLFRFVLSSLFSCLVLSCLSSSVFPVSLCLCLSLSVSVWCCGRVVVLCCVVLCVRCGVLCRVVLCGTMETSMCTWCGHTQGRFERTHGDVLDGHTGTRWCHRQFCLPKICPHGVLTCPRGPPKKPLDLSHFQFENRSRTTCSRFLQSFALPVEICSDSAILRDTAEGCSFAPFSKHIERFAPRYRYSTKFSPDFALLKLRSPSFKS